MRLSPISISSLLRKLARESRTTCRCLGSPVWWDPESPAPGLPACQSASGADDPPTWPCACPWWVSRNDPQNTGSVDPGIPHSLRSCCPMFSPSLYFFLELQMLGYSMGELDVTFVSSSSLEPSTELTWSETSILSWTRHAGIHSFNRSFNNCYYLASVSFSIP